MIFPIVVPMEVASSQAAIPMRIAINEVTLPMSIGVTFNIVDGEVYDGETSVSPVFYDSQILKTKNKLMLDDVTVHPISIQDVDNPSGGYTVTIGQVL